MASASTFWTNLIVKLINLLQKCNAIVQPWPLFPFWHRLRLSTLYSVYIPLERFGSASGSQPVLFLPIGPIPPKALHLVGCMVMMRDGDWPVKRVASLKVRSRCIKPELAFLAVDGPRETGLIFELRPKTDVCHMRCVRYHYALVVSERAMD